MKKVLTTGEVAAMMGASPRAVQEWCNKGMLPCFILPASQHRRVLLSDVVEFARQQKIPLSLFRSARALALGDVPAGTIAALRETYADVVVARDPFTAGLESYNGFAFAVVDSWIGRDVVAALRRAADRVEVLVYDDDAGNWPEGVAVTPRRAA